ncbi:arginine repressor [Vagococcus sp. DIV0080]|uniref:Arginine repressor n=1 Tax=Candidatus Vagococcus giribetii TaxID=2230876 RepID=A0ABS3HTA8_9ENTE|nr:arginine repressor [Vagococcus sp. DIV0080]MBO0476986.1 arginine repressor [Vagococcus sp. DIV0080]
MKKEDRQSLITQIIANQPIENQHQLIEELAKEGVVATQATVSRDIKELRIVKVHGEKGVITYGILPEVSVEQDEHLRELFQDSVSQVTQVQCMNVINTLLGTADVVAAEIDELQMPEIVGTLAGTDTIVLISTSDAEAKRINKRLVAYL